MAATVWIDSRPVAVLSTTAPSVLMSSDISRRPKDGTVVSVPRPQSVGHYQSFFRGVDIVDQFRSKYLVGRLSKKWWKYVLFFLITTVIIDAFLIMKGSVRFQKKKKYRKLDLCVALAQILIGMFRTPRSAPVRRQQSMLTTTHKFVKPTNKNRMARIVSRLSLKRERTHLMDVDYMKFICRVLFYFKIILTSKNKTIYM